MLLGCMTRGMSYKIGGSLGLVEDVAVAEDDVGWGRCLRVRVEIDLFQPLDRGQALLLTGASCWVTFKYEKLLAFYYRCRQILHGAKGCSAKTSNRKAIQMGFQRGVPVFERKIS
jgi:hypothetical protein